MSCRREQPRSPSVLSGRSSEQVPPVRGDHSGEQVAGGDQDSGSSSPSSPPLSLSILTAVRSLHPGQFPALTALTSLAAAASGLHLRALQLPGDGGAWRGSLAATSPPPPAVDSPQSRASSSILLPSQPGSSCADFWSECGQQLLGEFRAPVLHLSLQGVRQVQGGLEHDHGGLECN